MCKGDLMKIGIIGCGIITQEAHLPALLKLKDKIEVAALCNHSLPKAEKTADLLGNPALPLYTDWKKMIEEMKGLEAVLVSLPIPLNYPVSKACIEAGLNVMCEKPAGVDSTEAEKTLELGRPGGPLFMTAENYEYYPAYIKAGELVRRGLIGRVHSLHWNVMQFMPVENKYNQTRWRNHNAYPGGYVMDGGVHFVHALQMIAGPVVSAFGKTASLNPQLGTMDMGFALLTHSSGAVSSLNMGWQHGSMEEHLKVFGTEGSLILKEKEIVHLTPEGLKTLYPLAEEDSFHAEWLDFYNAVVKKENPLFSQERIVGDVRVIEAIIRSGQTGEVITIG